MDNGTESKPTKPKWKLGDELPFVLLQQSIILVLASMILDGGNFAQKCFYGFAAYWGGILVLRFRLRKGEPTNTDLLLIRYGFLLVSVISVSLTSLIWHFRGLR